MAVNDSLATASQGVADGSDFTVDGSSTGTGAAQIVEMGGTAAGDVYREVDIDGDGTYEVSVKVGSFSGSWHSQDNTFRVSQSQNSRIRVNNTSGGGADYFAAGFEVDN